MKTILVFSLKKYPLIELADIFKPAELKYTFIHADLNNEIVLREQKLLSDVNLIIYNPINYTQNFLLDTAMVAAEEYSKTLIFLETRYKEVKMNNEDLTNCLRIIRKLTSKGAIAILNDKLTLLNSLLDNSLFKPATIQTSDYIRIENIVKYKDFLKENCSDNFVENRCLLSQSINIITRLNERVNIIRR